MPGPTKKQIATGVEQFYTGQLKNYPANNPNGKKLLTEDAYRRILKYFPAEVAAKNTNPVIAKFLSGNARRTNTGARSITTDAYHSILKLLVDYAKAPAARPAPPNASTFFDTPGTPGAGTDPADAPGGGLDPLAVIVGIALLVLLLSKKGGS